MTSMYIVLPYFESEWEDIHIFPLLEEAKSYFMKKYLKNLEWCMKNNKYQEFQLRIEEFKHSENGYIPSYNNYSIDPLINPHMTKNMESLMDNLKTTYDKLKKDSEYFESILLFHKSSMNFDSMSETLVA